MKFISLLFCLSVVSAHAGVTPFLLHPDVSATDTTKIISLAETLLKKKLSFNIFESVSEVTLFKDISYRSYECQQLNPTGTQYEIIDDCMIRVFTNLKTSKVTLIKYDIPQSLPQRNLTKVFKKLIPVHELYPEVQIALDTTNLKFTRKAWFEGKLTYLFESSTRETLTKVYVDVYSGVIVGKVEEELIQNISAELYPVYEEIEVWDSSTRAGYLGKGKSEKVTISSLGAKTTALPHPFFPSLVGSYDEDLDQSWKPEASGPGTWNLQDLKVDLSISSPSATDNTGRSTVLDGPYISISVHPAAVKFLDKPELYFPYPHADWTTKDGKKYFYVVNESVAYGPLNSRLDSKAVRDSQHDFKKMMKDPTDALHVYQGTHEFFTTLKKFGLNDFSDSELKVRGYLYDTNPLWVDNAYFKNGTINFTTYSHDAPNFARDSTVIWHELGHSIFYKYVNYNIGKKGFGMNEGFSDFISHFVFRAKGFSEDYPHYKSMRYYSEAKFNIANQVHDDGEAYVGALKDILEDKIRSDGPAAFNKTLQLVISTLKYLRESKNLSEQEFFHTLLLVDDMGSDIRKSGEFKSIIEKALKNRNFSLRDDEQTYLVMSVNEDKIDVAGKGSRNDPYVFTEDPNASHEFVIKSILVEKPAMKINYPFRMHFFFSKHPRRIMNFESVGASLLQVSGPDEEKEFKFIVKPKCLTYNETESSCLSSTFLILYNEGKNVSFGKRRIFFRFIKP